jgi:hypothetical protein
MAAMGMLCSTWQKTMLANALLVLGNALPGLVDVFLLAASACLGLVNALLV